MFITKYHEILGRLLSKIDSYLPEDIRGNPFRLRQSRVLMGTPLVGLALVVEFVYRFNTGESVLTLMTLAGILLTFFLCPLVLSRTGSESSTGKFLCFLTLAIVILGIWVDGGINTPAAEAGPLFVVLFSFLLSPFLSFVATSLFCLNLMLVCWAHIEGLIPMEQGLDPFDGLWIKLLVNFVVLALIRLYDSSRRETERHLVEVARFKANFLANMSHDIRTPLNAILGLTQVLEEEYGHNPETRKSFQTISRAGERLLYLVNNILDYSYFQSSELKLNISSFHLTGLLKEIKSLTEKRAQEKALAMTIDLDPKIHRYLKSDPDRLKQAFLNIVTNAVKYTDRGGIKIQAELIENYEKEQLICFSFSDTGMGIPQKKMKNLFSCFEQAHKSVSIKKGGVGLGLGITKMIVDSMGGEISVESKEGVGSNFMVTLTLEKDLLHSVEKEKYSDKSLNFDIGLLPKMKILVAEDVDTNLLLLQLYTKKTRVHLTPCENGRVALDHFKKGRFDLVFMDIQMPVMDGYAATKAIREYEREEGLTPTPIVGLSAFSSVEDIEKAKKAGCTSYLRKPVDKYEFLKEILKHRKT